MSKSFFPQDNYITAPGRERLLHRLLFRSRLYYILRFSLIVFRFWPQARRGHFDFDTWQEASFRVFKAVEDCGGRFRITGFANIQKAEGPVVFIANHMSTMETLVLPSLIFPRKKPVFVIKEQLQRVPFFGVFVRRCIAVTRKSPAEDFKQVMTHGAAALLKGHSVIVFPQATRYPGLDPSKFNTLGIKLARKNHVPVIPIAIKSDFWTTGKILKDFGPLDHSKTIHFEFGEPLHIKGAGKQEHQQIISFIQTRLDQWQEKNE